MPPDHFSASATQRCLIDVGAWVSASDADYTRHDDFAAGFAARYAKRKEGLVEWGCAAAAGADPFGHRFPTVAASAGSCLLARPPRAQPHRPVSVWAFLRLELGFFLRVCQVRDILGKQRSGDMAMSFSRDLLPWSRWPVP